MFVLAVQTEIFDIGYCWIVHLSFLTSHNLLFFRFCKTSKKTTFSVFLPFFSRKIAQISIFKVEYLENGVADFNDFGLILQDFERPFGWNQLVLALHFSFKRVISQRSNLPPPLISFACLPYDSLKQTSTSLPFIKKSLRLPLKWKSSTSLKFSL